MENASRAEAFPVGLRVLVVDDDPTWLKIIEKMLRKCSYEVTACCLARVALDLLRERREKFDIVISDVNMPDMDGFKLLEHVGFEMDLPVIMMSVDGETCRVMKGVQHGACDYLIKPIRMKELRNIWQHVYRKKIHEVREIEGHEICEEIQMFGNGSEDFDERQVSGGADLNSVRKRKDLDGKEHSDQECNDSAAVKKARVLWSVDLHQKFMNAVNQIGFDKVGPKKILDLMNVPGLTRENVASHLQKYRLYLSRLQKQNEEKTYGGNLQAELHPKGPQANFGLQNPTAASQPNAACKYVPIAQNFQAQNRTPNIHVDDLKSTVDLMFKRSKGSGEDKTSLTQIKPVFTNYKSRNSIAITPVACTIDSVSVQVERGIVNSQDFGTKHETNGLASWIPPSREPSMKNETDLISVPEDFPLCSLQNFGCFDNLGLNNVEFFQYNDSTSLTELHSNWYDGLEFNYECLNDPVEYPIIDDCLFA